ncbi:MAG: response regulator transcription factor [Sulfuricurvum sp.]|jgi:DNA-binding response OmpR family regulator|uniref:response regulator transcription factor n=1 Tax=Sulfuricurvum sp. TaxID=2025608 RepID=UPI0025E0B9E8|nr:response regulator transcription factor [Sulfuricurvum sp.]MCK9371831.1 response regulator transcription factor [Sulfuricurvum sp.]
MRILIADDEEELLELLKLSLEGEWIIDTASTIDDAQGHLDAYTYQVAIFDRTFSGKDRIQELIRYAKYKNPQQAVLVLSALGSVDDKVEGLEYGADDYREKPFDIKELRARILALSRRFAPQTKEIEGIVVDQKSQTLFKNGEWVALSKNEHTLFFYLLSRDSVATREEIMDAMYDNPQNVTPNAIDELVARLRKKLTPSIIKTIKTRGYRIES